MRNGKKILAAVMILLMLWTAAFAETTVNLEMPSLPVTG